MPQFNNIFPATKEILAQRGDLQSTPFTDEQIEEINNILNEALDEVSHEGYCEFTSDDANVIEIEGVQVARISAGLAEIEFTDDYGDLEEDEIKYYDIAEVFLTNEGQIILSCYSDRDYLFEVTVY